VLDVPRFTESQCLVTVGFIGHGETARWKNRGGEFSMDPTLNPAVSQLRNSSRVQNLPVPRPLLEDWTWQERGSCRQSAPEVFFPEDAGRSGLRAREERAKEICHRCPVLVRCREYALAVGETHGVWGAMSARERTRAFAEGA
jgi:WhiB family transcriptional regulator, redox-sensing transcriptional regulator